MHTYTSEYVSDKEVLFGVITCLFIQQALPKLCELDASSCARLTDAGAAQLAHHSLQRLSLAGCRLLTEAALDHLARCPNLVR